MSKDGIRKGVRVLRAIGGQGARTLSEIQDITQLSREDVLNLLESLEDSSSGRARFVRRGTGDRKRYLPASRKAS